MRHLHVERAHAAAKAEETASTALRDERESIVAGLSDPATAQIGLVLSLASAAALPLAWHGVRRLVPARNVVFARWGFSHVALAALAFVAGGFVAGLLAGEDPGLAAQMLLGLIGFGAVLALIARWAVQLDPDGVRALGLRAGGNVRAMIAAVLAYAIALPGIMGLGPAWIWFLERVGHDFAPQEVAARYVALDPSERLVPILLGAGLQPLLEEVLFRSFLQPLLVQNVREVAGVALTSLVFAALHPVDVFLPLFALSCLLGAIMLRTQRLSAAWLVHALHNGLMFALMTAVPELATKGGGA